VREEYTPKLVMYGSTQTHSLGTKAGQILGMPFRALSVHADDGYALRGETLRAAVEEDLAKGLVPFFAIGTVGTTSSGAIDYIAELGQVGE
jgi:aromatic-L-amino-acid decarboxylase